MKLKLQHKHQKSRLSVRENLNRSWAGPVLGVVFVFGPGILSPQDKLEHVFIVTGARLFEHSIEYLVGEPTLESRQSRTLKSPRTTIFAARSIKH